MEVSRGEAVQVAAWFRFCEDEKGFYPPSLACQVLGGMTHQGVLAAADRGWLRYAKVRTVRFYSRESVYRYRERISLRDHGPTPLERHYASHGIELGNSLPLSIPSSVSDWEAFLRLAGGAMPARVASWFLRIAVQSVRVASDKGWIRCFRVSGERYYAANDVRDYVPRASKALVASPRFRGRTEIGSV